MDDSTRALAARKQDASSAAAKEKEFTSKIEALQSQLKLSAGNFKATAINEKLQQVEKLRRDIQVSEANAV